MKILILGGSGRTGKLLIQEALARGHTIHALVRSGSIAADFQQDSRLIYFTGTPYNQQDVCTAMQGCHAVLNALNISRQSEFPWSRIISPEDFLSSSMQNVVHCMQEQGISRVIVITAWGVGDSKSEIPAWFKWFVENSNIKYPYVDHEKQEKLLHASGLNWTIIRPSGLTNTHSARKVQVSFQGTPKPRLTIGRKHVAAFMMEVLEKNLYICQSPTIS